MDVAIHQVNELTVRQLQHELRKRKLIVSGIKADLRTRLVKALRTDFHNGWTCGYLLNMRLIPFNGDGIDPLTLVGLYITSIDECRSRGNAKLSFSNGDSVFIFSRPATTAADPVCVYYCDSSPILKSPCARSPMRILEAAMAKIDILIADSWPFLLDTVFVLKVEGMGKKIYIGHDLDKGHPDTILRGVYLAAQEGHLDLDREELLIADSG